MSQNNNPYAKAAGAYDQNAQKNAPSQRELEARILLKSNRMLQSIQNDWDNLDKAVLEDALNYNRQIWMLFYDTALETNDGSRPNDLRSNIVNLANFIFKREIEILTAPKKEKLDILININREIAAGLMTGAQASGSLQPDTQQNAPTSGKPTDISG
jgi:flagellar biosynthesis activator protein FlaF